MSLWWHFVTSTYIMSIHFYRIPYDYQFFRLSSQFTEARCRKLSKQFMGRGTQLLTKSSNEKWLFSFREEWPIFTLSRQFPFSFNHSSHVTSQLCAPNVWSISNIYAWGNSLGFVSVQLAKSLAPNIGWIALLSLELLNKGLSVRFWHPSVLPAHLCHNVSHILGNQPG